MGDSDQKLVPTREAYRLGVSVNEEPILVFSIPDSIFKHPFKAMMLDASTVC